MADTKTKTQGWAVIEEVEPYHPVGDTTREKTTTFVHWIFDNQKAANATKKDLALAGKKVTVKKVTDEPWSLSPKKKEGAK
jgi:hypothetical protein